MFLRKYRVIKNQSFFLFGPRATGKTTWLRETYPKSQYIDLLNTATARRLKSNPERLEGMLTHKHVIIDEIQKVPELLDEVHRLIEQKKICFILTGSSARKLRKGGNNLLAGRAYYELFYPLTCWEIGEAWDLKKAVRYGLLPQVWQIENQEDYLEAYVNMYLQEEVAAESLVRNLSAFSRLLEIMSFSQGQAISYTSIATDVGIQAKLVASYIQVLEDLLLSVHVPVFTKRAKRRLSAQSKFFFFDTGVFRTLRPKGPLDIDSEAAGPALETIFLQHHNALMAFNNWDQKLYYWRTAEKEEVDFVSYGRLGLFAFEIKLSPILRNEELSSLKLFKKDYPISNVFFLYTGEEEIFWEGIHIMNFEKALWRLPEILSKKET